MSSAWSPSPRLAWSSLPAASRSDAVFVCVCSGARAIGSARTMNKRAGTRATQLLLSPRPILPFLATGGRQDHQGSDMGHGKRGGERGRSFGPKNVCPSTHTCSPVFNTNFATWPMNIPGRTRTVPGHHQCLLQRSCGCPAGV